MPRRSALRKAPERRRPTDILRNFERLADTSLLVPDVIEFAVSDRYCNRKIYPVQGTLLKIIFLQDDLFTQFDYDVIEDWSKDWERTGYHGLQPDLLERMAQAKVENRPWFREVVAAIGRRGSKGFIGALAGAYVLWNFMSHGDPQGYYSIDRDKRLSMMVFAGKKEQAVKNQWGDLRNVIVGAPCFHDYISRSLKEILTVYSPYDFVRLANREAAGIYDDDDAATFEVVPKESTLMASRGPASFCQMFDEFAHVDKRVASASADELWESATPALDTFGPDAFIYQGSSTWQMIGKFYDNWLQSNLHSDGADGHLDGEGHQLAPGAIVRPEIFMCQLESWDPYRGWEEAHYIPLTSAGNSTFARKTRPMQAYDAQMKRLEAANPEGFAVERRSRWAAVQDAYLRPVFVERMFEPWPAEEPINLEMVTSGRLSMVYKAHADPSKSGANTGFAIAHLVQPAPPEGWEDQTEEYKQAHPVWPHVIFDVVHHWSPEDFEDNEHEIDYNVVLGDLKSYAERFMPEEFTFDQGYSAWLIQQLRQWTRTKHLPKRVNVFERTATHQQNWTVAETFKMALNLGLIHSPPYEQLRKELLFLTKAGPDKVDHPTSGPVQTKDVADCAMILVHALIGNEIAAFVGRTLGDLPLGGGHQGGLPVHPGPVDPNEDSGLSGTVQQFNQFSRGLRRQNGGGGPARGLQRTRQGGGMGGALRSRRR